MNMFSLLRCAGISLLMWLPASAMAGWQLNSKQALVSFVSIKNNAIAELHRFDSLTGSISDDGKATVTISLGSVNTGIEIRDERMEEFLFSVADFPQAVVTTQLDPEWLSNLQQGQAYARDLEFTVDLHGKQQTVKALTGMIIDAKGSLHVETIQPVLLDANQFGLGGGIAKLQELAALQAIATAVPVTFALVFKPEVLSE